MTQQEIDDEVCRIMMESGPDGHCDGHELLTALVMRCVAAEREACANVCDAIGASAFGSIPEEVHTEAAAMRCASEIRAR